MANFIKTIKTTQACFLKIINFKTEDFLQIMKSKITLLPYSEKNFLNSIWQDQITAD